MHSSFQSDWLVTLESIFDREMSECIHQFREDWLVTLESVFDWEMSECIHHFREDWLGYIGEHFRSGNE